MKASFPVICLMVLLGLLCLYGVGVGVVVGLMTLFGEKQVARQIRAWEKVPAKELVSLAEAGYKLPPVKEAVTGKILSLPEIQKMPPDSEIVFFSKNPQIETFDIYRRNRPPLKPSDVVFMLTSLLIGLVAGYGIYWLVQSEETIEVSLLSGTEGPKNAGPIVTFSHIIALLAGKARPEVRSGLSERDWKSRFRLPRPSTLRSRVNVSPVLWHRGTGMIVMGVLHLGVPGLAWQAAIPLIFIGFLNIVLPVRGMFILNGLLLLGIGILNALSGWGSDNVLWKYFGIAQGGWGVEEMGAFHVNRPRFSPSALNDHISRLADPKARAEFLIGVFCQRRQFDIRRGILNRLADMGEEGACVAPTLRLFLVASSVPLAVKVWIHHTLSVLEGSMDDHSRGIATILKEHAHFGEGSGDDNAPQKAATDALVSMGEHGLRALLSITSDPECRAEARAIAIEALGKQMGDIKDPAMRVDIVSAWVGAIDDKRVHGCVRIRARHALTELSRNDLGNNKDDWSRWWCANKGTLTKKWESQGGAEAGR